MFNIAQHGGQARTAIFPIGILAKGFQVKVDGIQIGGDGLQRDQRLVAAGDEHRAQTSLMRQLSRIVGVLKEDNRFVVRECHHGNVVCPAVGDNGLRRQMLTDGVAIRVEGSVLRDVPVLAPGAAEVTTDCADGVDRSGWAGSGAAAFFRSGRRVRQWPVHTPQDAARRPGCGARRTCLLLLAPLRTSAHMPCTAHIPCAADGSTWPRDTCLSRSIPTSASYSARIKLVKTYL